MTADRAPVVTAKHLGSLAFAHVQRLIGTLMGEVYSPDVHKDVGRVQNPLQVQALDFSRWLLQNIRKDDHVYLQMNAAGAEYLILEQLIVDGSVLLVDEINIVWHDEDISFSAGWPDLFEDIMTKLGLQCSGPRHQQQHSL